MCQARVAGDFSESGTGEPSNNEEHMVEPRELNQTRAERYDNSGGWQIIQMREQQASLKRGISCRLTGTRVADIYLPRSNAHRPGL